MAKLASMHRRTNICLPTSKDVFDLNQKHLLADMQNVLDEHEMFEKFGGGETSKQRQAVETISCKANNVSQDASGDTRTRNPWITNPVLYSH